MIANSTIFSPVSQSIARASSARPPASVGVMRHDAEVRLRNRLLLAFLSVPILVLDPHTTAFQCISHLTEHIQGEEPRPASPSAFTADGPGL